MLERYVGEIEGLLVCRASLVVPKKLAHIVAGGDAENHCTSCTILVPPIHVDLLILSITW